MYKYPFHANKQLSMQIGDCISYIPGNNKELTTSVPPKGTKVNLQSSILIDPGLSQTVKMDTMFSWATFAKMSASIVDIFLNHLMCRHVAFLKLLV